MPGWSVLMEVGCQMAYYRLMYMSRLYYAVYVTDRLQVVSTPYIHEALVLSTPSSSLKAEVVTTGL